MLPATAESSQAVPAVETAVTQQGDVKDTTDMR
jgi:hypothetical protein